MFCSFFLSVAGLEVQRVAPGEAVLESEQGELILVGWRAGKTKGHRLLLGLCPLHLQHVTTQESKVCTGGGASFQFGGGG